MIGMGTYLMSEGGDLKSLGQTENKKLFQLSLNMIAVTRLVMGNINIAPRQRCRFWILRAEKLRFLTAPMS